MEAVQVETDISLEHSTTVEKNIQENIMHFYNQREEIERRIEELDNEWDIERVLGFAASTLIASGLVLSNKLNKRWMLLPAVLTGFLFSHSVTGWCPPTPLLKALGFRSRGEIDKEKFALKALRGDFKEMIDVPNSVWSAVNK